MNESNEDNAYTREDLELIFDISEDELFELVGIKRRFLVKDVNKLIKEKAKEICDLRNYYRKNKNIGMKHYLYRMYNDNKEVLYVGRTKHLKTRIRSHFMSKLVKLNKWKRNVIYIDYALVNNQTDLSIYEAYYINKYKNLHNKSLYYNQEATFKLKELRFSKLIPLNKVKKLKHPGTLIAIH